MQANVILLAADSVFDPILTCEESLMSESVDLKPLNDLLDRLPEKTTDVIPILQRAQATY